MSAPPQPRRIELILRQIDSLPTLPAIATRLLSLTASDESNAREVIELVRADPTLTAKVLSLCRSADRGVQDGAALTVDRAVVLLGFSAIRNAVLSVKVLEHFDPAEPALAGGSPEAPLEALPAFDRVAFWEHSLAVAILAERIAFSREAPPVRSATSDAASGAVAQEIIRPDEAFVCGLLHDVGKLALDHVLPKSFARVLEMAEMNQGNIAEYERRVMGLDHHTAGKRLAQQWQLPHRLLDCIWLHGSNYDTLPRLPHRRLVGLVTLADVLVRQRHVGYSGNFSFSHDADRLAAKLGFDPAAVRHAADTLHEELERRGKALGLHDKPSRELFLQSIQRANQTLGRLNGVLEKRNRVNVSQSRVLEAISAFHAAAVPGRSVQDVMDEVAASARQALGAGFYAMLYLAPPEDTGSAPLDRSAGEAASWIISEYAGEGQAVRSQCIEAPPHAPDLSQLDAQQPVSLNLMGLLPWIADYLLDAEDLRQVKLLPLACGWGTAAVLLHDRATLPPWPTFAALAQTWGAAIAGAAQHDGARRLGEQLAEANAELAQTQDRLLRQESLARLGEMASGAAHEMNNPLAVIAGRSQLLSVSLDPRSKEQQAAQAIFREAHRLSDLISSLRMVADPPRPQRQPCNLATVLHAAIKKVRIHRRTDRSDGDRPSVEISLQLRQELPAMRIDPEQLGRAVMELLDNAVQAKPRRAVHVVAQLEPESERVVVRVRDDGEGMDAYTLEHAMDPFFSAQSAGRRVGMGLCRAQQFIAAHGGTLELRSTPGQGTTATFWLPVGSC